ncbi:hypothetical protein PMIN06_012523 [Paraphaeosphaeria minitans]
MAYTLLLSHVPALAYSSDPTILSSCRLAIKYSKALKQAAIFLRMSLHIHGFENGQSLSLMYQADNLSSIFMQPTTEILSADQRKEIARRGGPILKTLHLRLHTPCRIHCPSSAQSIAPKSGHDSSFYRLQDLARAVVANVIFDISYVHEKNHAAFFHLIARPDQLAALPASEPNASPHKDWTVFVPAEPVHGAPDEEDGSEAPPQYTKAPAKRAANLTTPSPRREHKRRPNFFPRASSSDACPPSPTEKATSTTASPKPPLSSPTPSDHAPDIRHLVANAVESLLPEVLDWSRRTEKNALEEQLPQALQKLNLAWCACSPSRDGKVDANTNPDLKAEASASADVSLKALFSAYIREIAQQELDEMHFSASRDAVHALEEAADDLKADLSEAKNEGITELQYASETSLNHLQDAAAEVITHVQETLEGHADEVYTEVWDDVSDLATIKGDMDEKVERRVRMMVKQVSGKGRRRNRLGQRMKP